MTLAFTASDQFAGDPNPNTYYTGADPYVPIPVKRTFKVTDKTMRMMKTTMVSVALVCSLLAAFSVQVQGSRAALCGRGEFCRNNVLGPVSRCKDSSGCPPSSRCCFYLTKGCVCYPGDRLFNFRS
ncbi:uncharacterized protein LOC143028227 isoform X1 [Oratosquilla oratoria]|uniref:uncharacterized protein LOC143028227 isoform X1 n=1 Tax=Oratosquilla oratoria TaxID=337810 RepID=UPI003F75C71A